MIDTTRESIISLSDATRRLPKFNGKNPHPSSVWRWCKIGLDGVKLEHIKVGGRMCTSIEALDRFFNREDVLASAPVTPSTKRLAETSDRLSKEGI